MIGLDSERLATIMIGRANSMGSIRASCSRADTIDGRTVGIISIPQKWDWQGTSVQTTKATSDFILKCSLSEDKRIEPKHFGEQIAARASDRLLRRI
jgi:hypothetical protein